MPLEVLASLSSNNKVFNIILENYPSLLTCRSLSDNGKLHMINDKNIKTSCIPVKMRVTQTKVTINNNNNNNNQRNNPPVTTPDTIMMPLLPSSANTIIGKITKDDSKVFPAEQTNVILKKKPSIGFTDHPHYLKNIRVHR